MCIYIYGDGRKLLNNFITVGTQVYPEVYPVYVYISGNLFFLTGIPQGLPKRVGKLVGGLAGCRAGWLPGGLAGGLGGGLTGWLPWVAGVRRPLHRC